MIPRTKQIADFLTWTRAIMVPLLVWLGLNSGVEALPIVVIIVMYNWSADSLDGPLARRGSTFQKSWIGQRDLEIDMLFSTGLLFYLTASGFVSWPVVTLYILLWIVLFWWRGVVHTLGVLYQAPINVWFFIQSLLYKPQFFLLYFVWIVVAIVVTWPKFPKIIVPNFLTGLKDLFTQDQKASQRK